MTNPLSRCFSEVQLNGLRLRNRLIKAATFEGKSPNGHPTQALTDFHLRFTQGGIGMTTLGCVAAEADGRLAEDMLYMEELNRESLTKMISAIKQGGAPVSGQLSHCGGFTRNRQLSLKRPLGPSFGLNRMGMFSGMPFAEAMTTGQIRERVASFGRAAAFMKSVGFDAIEIHFGHGYGLSQFISPLTNKRRDEFGGSLENRMRLPLQVLAAVRESVGDTFPVLGKISMSDGMDGGITFDDSIEIAALLEKGGIDCIVCSAGTSSMNPMLMFRGGSMLPGLIKEERNPLLKLVLRLGGKGMFRDYPYYDLYLLDHAQRIRDRVKCAVAYLGGVCSAEGIGTVMSQGFDFIQLGRAMIYDPEFPLHVRQDPAHRSGCNHCNRCATLIQAPGGVYCVERQPAP